MVPMTSPLSCDSSNAPNYGQMFRLMETILPFEACLYHQVVPLSFEGEYLNLGMVNMADQAGLDYVKQLLGYISCTLVPYGITRQDHQRFLSAYLNYTKEKQAKVQGVSAEEPVLSSPNSKERSSLDPKAVPPSSPSPRAIVPPISHETFILDTWSDQNTPTDPWLPRVEYTESAEALAQDSSAPSPNPPEPLAPPIFPHTSVAPKTHSDVPKVAPPGLNQQRSSAIAQPPMMPPPPPSRTIKNLQPITLDAHYLASPIEVLSQLSAAQLLQELLARALIGGIGRLYFDRQEQSGRILWSQSGVLQSVLEHLDIGHFQQVLRELKTLVALNPDPIHGAQQVEMERLYQNHRILLRVRVMQGKYGEEATVQVLRGAALKFYEKKQIDRMGQDTLSLAQQLQRKLEQIRSQDGEDDTVEEFLNGSKAVTPTLSELSHALQVLNQTLKHLKE